MLHKLAKQVIAEGGVLWLPPVVAQVGARRRAVAEAMPFRPDRVTFEFWLDGIRPDIVAWKGERGLLVEVAVTHFCEHSKVSVLRERRLATVELDLSELPRRGDRDSIEDRIRRSAPRAWLYNGRLEAAREALRREIETARARRTEEEARRRERQAANRHELAAVLAKAHAEPPKPLDEGQEAEARAHLERIRLAGFGDKVGVVIGLPGCFTVAEAIWQAAVVDRFAIGEPMTDWHRFETKHVLSVLRLSGYIKPRFADIDEETAELVRAQLPCFMPPRGAIATYLAFLARAGVLRRDGDGWSRARPSADAARQRLKRKSLSPAAR